MTLSALSNTRYAVQKKQYIVHRVDHEHRIWQRLNRVAARAVSVAVLTTNTLNTRVTLLEH